MCGICGFVNVDKMPADAMILRQMTDTLHHRGPDDEGHLVDGPVALGMRRLSIIDLAGGHQPIPNEEETNWIIFNGELYNFPELRSRLEAAGHRFRTQSDTEAVLHAYEEWGTAALNRLNGMFAFAIWDSRQQQLILARDHVGIKPLYWGIQAGVFLFGSELKALMRHPCCSRELNLRSLDQYLTYGYVPSPLSIFEGINKLPPGHLLRWRDGEATLQQYWDVDLTPDDGPPLSDEEASARVLAALREAVRKELLADVPVGVLLSGGIDSSAVAALMAPLMPGGLDSFSIGFEDPSFDESRHAERVAAFIGTRHHALTVTPGMMFDIMPDLPSILDEPMADASIVPTYILSRFARERVKVALGGDGGDELFAGYSTLQAHRLTEYYRLLPGVVRRRVVPAIVNRLPVSRDNLSFDYKAKRFVASADLPAAVRHHRWMGAFSAAEKTRLLSREVRLQLGGTDPDAILDEHLAHTGARSPLDKILYLDMKMYLEGDILVKTDRASMACSLETRVPLLNRGLIETVQRLPLDQKLRGFTRKYVLRQALRGILPPEILKRPKKGFGIPIAKWITGELRPLVEELFDERQVRAAGYFDPTAIRALLDEHVAGRRDNRMQLWTLMLFQLWQRQHLSTTRPVAVAGRN